MENKTTQIMKLNLHGRDYRVIRNNGTGFFVLTVSENVFDGWQWKRTKAKIGTFSAPEDAVIHALRYNEGVR